MRHNKKTFEERLCLDALDTVLFLLFGSLSAVFFVNSTSFIEVYFGVFQTKKIETK